MSRIYSFWDFIRRHKFIVVAVFFAVMIGFVDEDSFYNRYLRNQEISALRALNDLQTSREAVVRVAREQYFMKYPDEDVYVVMDAQKEPEKTETDENAVED